MYIISIYISIYILYIYDEYTIPISISICIYILYIFLHHFDTNISSGAGKESQTARGGEL